MKKRNHCKIYSENSNKKTIKYLAYLDILGFKDLVRFSKIEKIEGLYNNLQKSVLYSIIAINPNHRLHCGKNELSDKEKINLNSLVVSDSIIIWTDDDTQKSFYLLILAVKHFMYFSIQLGLPLRGGISCSNLLVKTGSYLRSPKNNSFNTLLGASLIRAYELERGTEWVGCVIDEKCVEHFNDKIKGCDNTIADLAYFEEIDMIRLYKVPMKSGEIKEYFTVNWTHFLDKRLTRTQVKKAFREHNKETNDWSVERKLQNSLKYLDQTKPHYKRLITTIEKRLSANDQ